MSETEINAYLYMWLLNINITAINKTTKIQMRNQYAPLSPLPKILKNDIYFDRTFIFDHKLETEGLAS